MAGNYLAKPVLITRPIDDAVQTAEKLNGIGIKSIIHPMLIIEGLTIDESIANYDYLLLTSYNAVKPLKAYRGSLPNKAFFVGDKSASGLANLIPTVIKGDSIEQIKHKIVKAVKLNNRVVYISGSRISPGMQALLQESSTRIKRIIAYRSVPNNEINFSLLEQVSAILFYSSYTAKTFREFYGQKHMSALNAFCISKAVAQELQELKFNKLLVAESPTEAAIIKLLKRFY